MRKNGFLRRQRSPEEIHGSAVFKGNGWNWKQEDMFYA